MEQAIIPSFRQQRKPPVSRQVPIKLKTTSGRTYHAPIFGGKKKCNPHQFLAWRETNSGYEIEICPRHQILAWRCVYADAIPFMKWMARLGLFNTIKVQ